MKSCDINNGCRATRISKWTFWSDLAWQLVFRRPQEPDQRSEFPEQSFFVAGLAFPDLEHTPSVRLERGPMALVPIHIRAPLRRPKIGIRGRNRFAVLAPVHMPEATVDEEYGAASRKHEIGFPGQSLAVKPVSQSHPMQRFPYTHLGFGVDAANARHVETALRRGKYVSHISA
jgi:hypothetical protein